MSTLAPGDSGSVTQPRETVRRLHAVRHVPVLRSSSHAVSSQFHVLLESDWRGVDDTIEWSQGDRQLLEHTWPVKPTQQQKVSLAFVQVYDLWEGLQTENSSPATREDPHGLAPLRLLWVREDISSAVSSGSAPPHPFQREAVRLHRLLPDLPTACHPQPAPAHSQRGAALLLYATGLWETVSPEIQSGSAHPHAPRRVNPTLRFPYPSLQYCQS